MPLNRLFMKPPSFGYSDLVNSDVLGWRSLGLRLTETSASRDEFESAPVEDVGVHIVIEEEWGREVFVSGRWRQLEVCRGKIATTAPGETWRLRYNNRKEVNTNRLLNLQIPQTTFQSVAEQLPIRNKSVYTAITDDETVTHFALAMLSALEAGASDFYAQSSALWLSTRLVLGAEKAAIWGAALDEKQISDVRLLRVLDYMAEHLKDDLSLQALAGEAGISLFQFATLFQKAMGRSPHKHVLHLRMQNAACLLRETRRPVSEIAMLCGFNTASHFGVAFHKHFKQSPTTYRSTHESAAIGSS